MVQDAKDGARTVNAWCEHWRQLGLQAWSAESDSRRETQNPRSISQEQLEDLRATLRKSEEEFHVWERELWSGMAKARKRVHVLARNINFAPQHEDVRRMVQAAEHDLRIFAEATRQQEDELAALECSLQDTLEASLARFEGWCSQESSLRKSPEIVSKPSRPPSCSRLRTDGKGSDKEGKQLDSMHEKLDKIVADLAADGGSTGGWTDEDHEMFMQVLRRFKRKAGADFLAEAQQSLLHKTHEDLVAHVSWLRVYEGRQLQKRQLVEQWRCMRASVAPSEAPVPTKAELTVEKAYEEKRQRVCSRERVHKEQEERRQRVAEWRNARNQERHLQEQERIRQEQEGKERETRERQRRQAENKQQVVNALREQRVPDETLRNGPPASMARPSPEDRKRIAERNASHLQKRASQLQSKRLETEGQRFEPPARSASVGANPAYRHVESRLEDHTKAFVDRSRDLREESVSSQPPSKYGITPGNFAHQGVVRTLRSSPSWRPHFGA